VALPSHQVAEQRGHAPATKLEPFLGLVPAGHRRPLLDEVGHHLEPLRGHHPGQPALLLAGMDDQPARPERQPVECDRTALQPSLAKPGTLVHIVKRHHQRTPHQVQHQLEARDGHQPAAPVGLLPLEVDDVGPAEAARRRSKVRQPRVPGARVGFDDPDVGSSGGCLRDEAAVSEHPALGLAEVEVADRQRAGSTLDHPSPYPSSVNSASARKCSNRWSAGSSERLPAPTRER
jgi:hypothetical protein